jgi:hypothetical protein
MHVAASLLLAGAIGAVVAPIVDADHADAPPAAQDTFEARVGLGKAVEEKEEFKSYHGSIGREVGDQYAATMRSCFATVQEPKIDAFTLVADITPDGNLSAVEVRPATNIACCFAAGLTKISFPKPPHYPGYVGFPMTIEMRIE